MLRKERDMPSPMKKPSFNVSKKMKRNCIVLACIGALFLIGMTAFGAYNNRPVKIPLDKFYQVELPVKMVWERESLSFRKKILKKIILEKSREKEDTAREVEESSG